ncbi:non-canonical purine NTP diphosphatase [Marinilabilia rubra]|uniref:dITP/XTP pyrophosphatase n=1 Tax=Marinilabilia rubra TaxID=2162893 RepID=A0A2U2B8V2_9BACT|nr:non-canonical purine NTP diphosphatase [Marinilabilia rubra]PWD99473.1 non-canonical purine NTP pyrophosphatase [Marinilabilia rubra]
MDLIFATNNQHKASEIAHLLTEKWEVKSLADIGFTQEVPETGTTLEANALQKARYIHNQLGKDCFADDTGLEIEALKGEPGVYSARYAGPAKDSNDNIRKVLAEMQDKHNRKARFRTVIALIINKKEVLFEGIVSGVILSHPSGMGGFGYDPIFKPDEATMSFAEMPLTEKNQISHRGRAVQKLVEYLKTIN